MFNRKELEKIIYCPECIGIGYFVVPRGFSPEEDEEQYCKDCAGLGYKSELRVEFAEYFQGREDVLLTCEKKEIREFIVSCATNADTDLTLLEACEVIDTLRLNEAVCHD